LPKENVIGTYLRVISHDDLFFRQSRTDPVIVNHFQGYTEEERKAFRDKIFTRYQPSDMLTNKPRCECVSGGLEGKRFLGVICDSCNKPVMNIRDQKLESLVWLKQPTGVERLIYPIIWTILSNHFKKGRFNVIHWLCDTKYPTPDKPPKIFQQLLSLDITRGYNYFVKNFFATIDPKTGLQIGPGIIEKLLTISDFRKKKQDNPNEVHHILRLLDENRNKIFSNYLALPNKTLLVVEDTDMAIYVDSNVPLAVDAIDSLIGLDDPLNGYTAIVRQNRFVRALAQLATYYQDFNKKTFSSKEGISRKHLVATRCDWSFRAVITSLTEDHYHRELHTPWGVSVGLLRQHLAAKLKRRGWLPNEIFRFLSRYATDYNPLIDELFQELIAESKYMGLPVVFQRNPSLGLGSMQLFYITKVKTDTADQTVSMSILTVRGFNADFDGDEMNGTLLVDDYMAERFEAMAPYKSTMSTSVPRTISGNLAKTKPWISTVANLLEAAPTLPPDPTILKRMELIPDAA
jgi:hypothetical protein